MCFLFVMLSAYAPYGLVGAALSAGLYLWLSRVEQRSEYTGSPRFDRW